MKDMAANLIPDLSFGKVARAFKTLLGFFVSKAWVHRVIKEYQVDFGHNEDSFGYMADGTGENVSPNKRGKELKAYRSRSLAMEGSSSALLSLNPTNPPG